MTSLVDLAEPEVGAGPGEPRAGRRPRRQLPIGDFVERYAILIAWAAVVVLFWIWKPDTFGTLRNFQTIFGSQSALLVLTLGLLAVLSAGEFDLSVGATFSLGGSLLAFLNVEHGWPVLLAALCVLACGLAFGALNAVVSIGVGVPSIVTTLGSGTLLGGLVLGICGPTIRSGISSNFVGFVRDKWFGLPHSFYFALGLTALTWYIFQHTPLGRHLQFVGKAREVARLSGVRVDAIRFASLVTSAGLATLGGMVLAGTTGSAQIGTGNGYLLPAFAAAFLGATAIIPGQFNAWGSWVSVYFLLTGITGLTQIGYSGWPEQVFYGGALVLAVVLSKLAAKVRTAGASAGPT